MLRNVGVGLDTLKELDAGRVSVAFAHELKRAVMGDIRQRLEAALDDNVPVYAGSPS